MVFVTLGAISTEIGQLAALQAHSVDRGRRGHHYFGLHLTGIFKIKALCTDARLHGLGSSTRSARSWWDLRSHSDGRPAWTDSHGVAHFGQRTGHAGQRDSVGRVFAGLAVPFLLTSVLMGAS